MKRKGPPRRAEQGVSPGTTGGEISAAVHVQATQAAPTERLDSEDSSFESARALWQFGDWQALAAIGGDGIQRHAERAKLALLAAAGHQQLGDDAQVRLWTRQALEWGCPRKLVAQVLIAGVHNLLGRASILHQDDERIERHFQAATGLAGDRQASLLGHARMVREMARLGLLPQATQMLKDEVARGVPQGARDDPAARLRILQTELELLSHELSLALQRGQLKTGLSGQETLPDAPAPGIQQRSVSQLGQDLWVLERSGFKRGGYFVEFGATDGVLLSNTWLLEHEFGWQGICAEPNPKFLDKLRQNRRCVVSDACVSAKTGQQVEFIFADAFGGIADYAYDDEHGDKRGAYRDAGETKTLTTVSLDELLRRSGAPRQIDYLSVDTEGSEYDILQAFPFDLWEIRLITVEHNYTPRRASIRALLEGHGYRCTEMQWDDWYEKVGG